MDNQLIVVIVMAVIFLPFFWFTYRGIRKSQRHEKPFVDRETGRALNTLLSTPLRPEDVPRAVTRRLGPLPPPDRRPAEAAPSGDGSSALTSGLVGYHTNSTLLGTLAGGDPIAAAIGDALRSDDADEKAKGCARPTAVEADPEVADAAEADADDSSGTDSCSSTE